MFGFFRLACAPFCPSRLPHTLRPRLHLASAHFVLLLQVEVIINQMLDGLRDKDTVVRWSAAKGNCLIYLASSWSTKARNI